MTVTTISPQIVRAVAYVRISEDREGAGLGVERQLEDIKALAARLGWTIVAVFDDNDVSAYNRRKVRKGYRRMLKFLAEGKATAVVAWHTDRLHRTPTELEGYIDVCEAHGVITQTVKAGHMDLSTPSGRAVARTMCAWAKFESEHKADRVRRAAQQRAEAGRFSGGPRRFGFHADGVNLRLAEAVEIARATEMILVGGSVRSVMRYLNDKGVVTSQGNVWEAQGVRDMLLRPRNAGLREHQGEVIGKAAHPAIVSETEWRAVVAILTNPSRRTAHDNRTRWLGSCAYRCVCGSVMTCRKANNQPTYTCRRTGGTGTVHTARAARALDRYVTDLVVARLSRADAVDLLAPTDARVDVVALSAERTALVERQNEAAGLFALGKLTGAQLASATAVLTAEITAIDGKLAEAATISPLAGVVGAADVRAAWDGLDLDIQRAVLRTLVRVTILPGKKGRPVGFKPNGGDPNGYFDVNAVRIEWVENDDVDADVDMVVAA